MNPNSTCEPTPPARTVNNLVQSMLEIMQIIKNDYLLDNVNKQGVDGVSDGIILLHIHDTDDGALQAKMEIKLGIMLMTWGC